MSFTDFPRVQGFEIDVFSQAASIGLNWTQGVDYYFVCQSQSVIVGVAGDGNGSMLDNSSTLCYAAASAGGFSSQGGDVMTKAQ